MEPPGDGGLGDLPDPWSTRSWNPQEAREACAYRPGGLHTAPSGSSTQVSIRPDHAGGEGVHPCSLPVPRPF